VVQMLLPHSSNLIRVISASIRSRERDIVKKVLDRSPDFASPAHSITRKSNDNRKLNNVCYKRVASTSELPAPPTFSSI
jgi:hypothetical protein